MSTVDQEVEAAGSLDHCHTFTWPVPSPVKKIPPGPNWMERISCFAKILPLSANLNQKSTQEKQMIINGGKKNREARTRISRGIWGGDFPERNSRWQIIEANRIVIASTHQDRLGFQIRHSTETEHSLQQEIVT